MYDGDKWWLVGGAVALLAAVFFLTDCCAGNARYDAGVVVDKYHETTTDKDGNTTDWWYIMVNGEGFFEKISVKRGKYDALKAGDKVRVTIRTGRFTGIDYHTDVNKGEI